MGQREHPRCVQPCVPHHSWPAPEMLCRAPGRALVAATALPALPCPCPGVENFSFAIKLDFVKLQHCCSSSACSVVRLTQSPGASSPSRGSPPARPCALPEMHVLFFSSCLHGKRMFRSERKSGRCFLGSACSKQPSKITPASRCQEKQRSQSVASKELLLL